ncbi:MAG: DUF2281 domain-containing protein [Xenococcaceae cyanobacterium]
MDLEQKVLKKFRELPSQQQHEVLNFVEFLQQKSLNQSQEKEDIPRHNLSDLLAKVTPENLHGEIDPKNAVGNEIG